MVSSVAMDSRGCDFGSLVFLGAWDSLELYAPSPVWDFFRVRVHFGAFCSLYSPVVWRDPNPDQHKSHVCCDPHALNNNGALRRQGRYANDLG